MLWNKLTRLIAALALYNKNDSYCALLQRLSLNLQSALKPLFLSNYIGSLHPKHWIHQNSMQSQSNMKSSMDFRGRNKFSNLGDQRWNANVAFWSSLQYKYKENMRRFMDAVLTPLSSIIKGIIYTDEICNGKVELSWETYFTSYFYNISAFKSVSPLQNRNYNKNYFQKS